MPTPPAVAPRAGLTRRAALVSTVALGVLSGCTSQEARPSRADRPSGSPTPETDPDVTLAAAVLAREQAALDVVHATARRHPALARRLKRVAAVHERHVRLLTDAVPAGARPTGPAAPAGGGVPRNPGAAVAAVARAEDRLALANRRGSFTARSGAFARLLASMAAAAAQQAAVLRQAGPVRR